jgi:adenine-specific DNA-methyltransferase
MSLSSIVEFLNQHSNDVIELSPDARKQSGAHYTPRELADFVAKQVIDTWTRKGNHGPAKILDPAVGDAELLDAILQQATDTLRTDFSVYGFDTSQEAIAASSNRIQSNHPSVQIQFKCTDFLDHVLSCYADDETTPLFSKDVGEKYHLVIANPPYIRTQVMGADRAQKIAKMFHLAGRIDIYYAFLDAVARVLFPGGIAGIIVSNRFMTVKSGISIREKLKRQFNILHIWDLGDTRLFEAAVLPSVILLERKSDSTFDDPARFTSIYSTDKQGASQSVSSPIKALSKHGFVQVDDGRRYFVNHGFLDYGKEGTGVWRISTEASENYLSIVAGNTSCLFGALGKVRVGVKTTADKVFIRSDWDSLPIQSRPELLRPLLTHHLASKYKATKSNEPKMILYPHEMINGKRVPSDLSKYPRTATYLESHRNILESREYIRNSNRKWYEIWVPHNPDIWSQPKLVFRDISQEPTFWLDLSGSVVNGDCYWLGSQNENDNLLWLALAVANSPFIEWFYDIRFHNKLYAGRRRFMTQYVEQFPIPHTDTSTAKELINLMKELYKILPSPDSQPLKDRINKLVWYAFGLSPEEIGW